MCYYTNEYCFSDAVNASEIIFIWKHFLVSPVGKQLFCHDFNFVTCIYQKPCELYGFPNHMELNLRMPNCVT